MTIRSSVSAWPRLPAPWYHMPTSVCAQAPPAIVARAVAVISLFTSVSPCLSPLGRVPCQDGGAGHDAAAHEHGLGGCRLALDRGTEDLGRRGAHGRVGQLGRGQRRVEHLGDDAVEADAGVPTLPVPPGLHRVPAAAPPRRRIAHPPASGRSRGDDGRLSRRGRPGRTPHARTRRAEMAEDQRVVQHAVGDEPDHGKARRRTDPIEVDDTDGAPERLDVSVRRSRAATCRAGIETDTGAEQESAGTPAAQASFPRPSHDRSSWTTPHGRCRRCRA